MPEFGVLVEGYRRFKSDAYVRQKRAMTRLRVMDSHRP